MLMLVLAFAKLGHEVNAGNTHFFDMQLLQYAQSLRAAYPWLAESMRDASGLGSSTVLALLTLFAVGYLTLVGARVNALLVATAVSSGTALLSVLKAAFGRLRPDAAYAEFLLPGLSFPSGQASISTLVFLTIGTLIAYTRSRRTERVYILLCAGLMAALVGLSRVALGVHWATDVLGGWAFGTAWALGWLLCWQGVKKQP